MLPSRQFQPLNVPRNPHKALTIATFNILADQYCNQEAFPNSDPACFPWEYRLPLLVAEIERAHADVIALQEVDHFDQLLAALKVNTPSLDGVFRSTRTESGNAIVFNTATVRLKYTQHVCIDTPHPDCFRGLYATFLHRATREPFSVLNLHLKSKEEFESVRVDEMRLALEHASREDATFIVGDLNTPAHMETIGMVENTDVYAEAHRGTVDCDMNLVTTSTSAKYRREKRSIVSDYIFYDKWHYKPTAYLSRFDIEALCPNLLPCKDYPSDHLLTAATFEFEDE